MNKNVVVFRTEQGHWLCFENPLTVIQLDTSDGVREALCRIEEAVGTGLYAAGFLSYEASSGFDPALKTHSSPTVPTLWFGLYSSVRELDALPADQGSFHVDGWESTVNEAEYAEALSRIREYIRAGDTYQVNYTLRLRSHFEGDPYGLFQALFRAQPARYSAYFNNGDLALCSASPELFLSIQGRHIVSRPMKGTSRRGLTIEEDDQLARELNQSVKNRAENVMIVDMVRNDLGRIADPGTVEVTRSFDVERYPTVLQMTSNVVAESSSSFADIMAALFPCASITGAPKVRTMEIIRELENTPRGLYTGCIGYLAPGTIETRRAEFNVAIRTVVLDLKTEEAEYGAGGGIVWDSEVQGEYEECLAKARILTTTIPEYDLLETMLWTPEEGLFLIEEHLERLAGSARYFDYYFVEQDVRSQLSEAISGLEEHPHRVRLTLSRTGSLQITVEGRLHKTPRAVLF